MLGITFVFKGLREVVGDFRGGKITLPFWLKVILILLPTPSPGDFEFCRG